MHDDRLSPDSEELPGPSRWQLTLGAAVVASFIIVLASTDPLSSDDLAMTDDSAGSSVASSTMTAVEGRVEEMAVFQSIVDYAGEDLEDDTLEWARISLPVGMDSVSGIGRFRGELTVIGGQRGHSAGFTKLLVATTAAPVSAYGDSWPGWQTPSVITDRSVIIERTLVGDDRIVVVARAAPSVENLDGSVYVFQSLDGSHFSEIELTGDGEMARITEVVQFQDSTILFGGLIDSPWPAVRAALPEEVRALLAGSLAVIRHDDGAVVVATANDMELMRFEAESLVGASVEVGAGDVWSSATWEVSAAGTIRRLSNPFGSNIVEHVRADVLGALVAQVQGPGLTDHSEFTSVNGEEWTLVSVFARDVGIATGSRGELRAFVDLNRSQIVVVDQDVATRLRLETPLHFLVVDGQGETVDRYGAVFSTRLAGNLNAPQYLIVARDAHTVQISRSGWANVWQSGEEVVAAPLEQLIELGRVDLSAQRVYLADLEGEVITYLELHELRALDPRPVTVPGGVGILMSADLARWTFTELDAAGVMTASYREPTITLVATSAPLGAYETHVSPTMWLGGNR